CPATAAGRLTSAVMATSRIRPLLMYDLLAKLRGTSAAPSVDTDPLAHVCRPLVWVADGRLSTAKMSAFATGRTRKNARIYDQNPPMGGPFLVQLPSQKTRPTSDSSYSRRRTRRLSRAPRSRSIASTRSAPLPSKSSCGSLRRLGPDRTWSHRLIIL